MLQLIQPLWLFALTGISIPVIIHLWNLKPGKVLKVGSISLVTESSKEYKKSLTLSDILLLILRCLLIAALAVALSKPAWRSSINSSKQKGWVLIS
ncbi:MAG: BatA domain-containing protein, partial [Bacteroidota bacterium]